MAVRDFASVWAKRPPQLLTPVPSMSKSPRLSLTQLEARDVPASLLWEGDLGVNWNAGTAGVATNWRDLDTNQQVKPQNGDTIVFDEFATEHVTTNDIVGLELEEIAFVLDTFMAEPYTITADSETLRLSSGVSYPLFTLNIGDPHRILAPLILTGDVTFSDLSFNDRGFEFGDIDLNGHAFDILYGSNTLELSGDISGDGSITITGGVDTVILGGDNTFTGVLSVNAELVATKPTNFGALGAGNETHVSSFVVPFGLAEDFGLFGGGALRFVHPVTVMTGTITLVDDATIMVAPGASAFLAGAVHGEFALTKSGAGTLVLSGSGSTFGGIGRDLEIDDGTVGLGGPDRIPDDVGVVIGNPATLALNGFDDTIRKIAGSIDAGKIDLGGGRLTLQGPAQEVYTGLIMGTGGITLNDGELRLQGSVANTYTGDTIVSGGVLTLDMPAGTNAFRGDLRVAGTGVVRLKQSDQIPDDVTVTTTTTGTFDLDGHDEAIGRLSGGNSSTTVMLGAGRLDLSFGGTVYNGVITGTGGLDVTGGVHTLAGTVANTFTGTTNVAGGTLRLNKTPGVNAIGGNLTAGNGGGADQVILLASNQLPNAATVFLNTSGVLDLNGFNETIAGLGSVAGGTVELGDGTLTLTVGNGPPIVGPINGTGGLTITGGVHDITGSTPNTFTGDTRVTGGTLRLGKDDGVNSVGGDVVITNTGTVRLLFTDEQIPDDATVQMFGAGVLDVDGNNETIGPLIGTATTTVTLGLGGGRLTLAVGNSFFDGVISGLGGLTIIGGEHTLSGAAANTFSEATNVEGGTLQLNKTPGVNAVGGDILMSGGGTARLLAPNQIRNTATVGVGTDGVLDLNGFDETVARLSGVAGATVDLGTGTLTLTGPVGQTFDGVITGGGGLTVAGGAHTLGGPSANTFTGTTRVTGGGLYLAKDDGVAAVSGEVVLSGGGLYLKANEQLPDDAVVTLEPDGVFNLADRIETIAALVGPDGTVDFDGELTVGGAQSATFGGVLAGDGAFVRTGTGTTTFTGDSPAFVGHAVVTSGTLIVDGTMPGATAGPTGGRFGGNGTVSTLVGTGGVIAPGTSVGRLTVTQVMSLGANATLEFELNGPTPGTGYDQIAVTGLMSLKGTLTILPGFVPALGDSFTLIDNDENDAVVGTFGGMPEGTVVKVAGFDYRISYAGGDGNDVVLTRVPLATGGTTLTAAGAGVGGAPRVQVFNADGTTRFDFFAFEESFRGGVEVAVGDVNADGTDDIVVAAGPGGAPRVRAFSGTDGSILMDFFAFDMTLRGGASVAVADLNADGFGDIVIGAGAGGAPHVRAVSGKDRSPMLDVFAYEPAFTGGVTVAAGDLDGDGVADIVTAPGAGGGPAIRAFNGTSGAQLLAFAAFDPALRIGFEVTTADVTGDGLDEIVVAPGAGGGPDVRAFDAKTGTQVKSFLPFDASFRGGVRLAGTGVGADGEDNLLFGTGPGVRGRLKLLDGGTAATLRDAALFDADFTGGVFVG